MLTDYQYAEAVVLLCWLTLFVLVAALFYVMLVAGATVSFYDKGYTLPEAFKKAVEQFK